MKIYTKRGDAGETDLFGGSRVKKSHPRVEAYGAIDELNAVVGLAAAESKHRDIAELLAQIQAALFALGSVLATPSAAHRKKAGISDLTDAAVQSLEKAMDDFEAELAPLANFILPGGSSAAAQFHVARTVCRRAERQLVAVATEETIDAINLRYVNRLSDFLFVLARLENKRAGVDDVEWKGF